MPAETPDDARRRLEEIVAYLDGEMSPGERAAVEQQLARDESFRQEMQRIERAWNALDELPRTTLDDRFSRTTMEMVVTEAAAEVDAKTLALPVMRRKRQWSTVLIAAAAALLGFLAVRIVRDAPNRKLIADLPAVVNVDRYQQFQSVEFLRQLHQRYGPQLRTATLSGAEVDEEAAGLFEIVRTGDRRGWLSGLDDQQRSALNSQYEQFLALTPEQQQRIRDLHRDVVAAEDDPTDLFATMIAYRRWLAQLPASRQFELRQMPADERLNQIGRDLHWRAVNEALELSDKELRDFDRAFREAIEQTFGARSRAPQVFFGRGRGDGPPPEDMLRVMAAIKASLPQRTQDAFEGLSLSEKRRQLLAWRRQAQALQRDVSRQELEEFFAEELDEQRRAELLTLPADQFEGRLRQLYLGRPGWDGPWGGGRGLGIDGADVPDFEPPLPGNDGPPPPGGGFGRGPRDGRGQRGGRGPGGPGPPP